MGEKQSLWESMTDSEISNTLRNLFTWPSDKEVCNNCRLFFVAEKIVVIKSSLDGKKFSHTHTWMTVYALRPAVTWILEEQGSNCNEIILQEMVFTHETFQSTVSQIAGCDSSVGSKINSDDKTSMLLIKKKNAVE